MQQQINHGKRAHALLSASGASRWINCTPSAKLEDEFGEVKTSAYAEEGTLAHELAELYLRHDLFNLSEDEFTEELEAFMSHELFNEEMLDAVPIYTDYCQTQFNAAKAEDQYAIIELEQQLDLTEYVPESFGTADCIIISDGTMEVIDLKYGKGIPVYAEYNKQLMLYGLGALRKFDTMYDIEQITLTIVQPRINNISSFTITVEALIEWAESELKPAAQAAFKGEGQLSSGEWCRFCAVKNKCRALYEKQLEIARYEFKQANLLTEEEIADVLKRAPQLVEWANSIAEYALNEALVNNRQWPGYKLVEGRSIRKWVDEATVINNITERIPQISKEDLLNTKLKTITEVEKLVGKKAFTAQLSDCFVKPQGKPTLVPLEDKRPALGTEDAKNDFK